MIKYISIYKYRLNHNNNEIKCQNGKIYQILNIVNDEVYVGSTIQPLCKSMFERKSRCNKLCTLNIYQAMRETGDDNLYIELIEAFPCNSNEELHAREGYYVRERGTLNKITSGRTPKEWVEEHKGRIANYQTQYKEEKQEPLNQYRKQYRKDNQEHIKEHLKDYRKDHVAINK